MTEHKRFELEYVRGKPNFWDNVVDLADCYLTCEDVVDLLNEQHETIQSLKQEIETLQEQLRHFDMGDLE